ncbi:MAG TPA: hypothetical protein VNE38_21590 [Ktedonobacteraceae bacterium]|nr:hypothetical protein [Ktedonobacteraceae bacterium]
MGGVVPDPVMGQPDELDDVGQGGELEVGLLTGGEVGDDMIGEPAAPNVRSTPQTGHVGF